MFVGSTSFSEYRSWDEKVTYELRRALVGNFLLIAEIGSRSILRLAVSSVTSITVT